MRPYNDASSTSSSSASSTSSFHSNPSSREPSSQIQHGARVLTRTPSLNPLHADYVNVEDDQEYEQAQRRLGTLLYSVHQVNSARQFDLAEVMALFKQIKGDDAALKLLARDGSDDDHVKLQQFATGMALCLGHFARFLASGDPVLPGLSVDGGSIPANSLLYALDAHDVHQLFNGISTLIDDGLRTHLYSKRQLENLGKPLRDINQALLVQAMLKGLPTDLPSNACLLDILNLQSRLLKAKLAAEDNKIIRTLFVRSLAIIEQWPNETGVPVTEAGKVVSRQLAKTLVQLNTIKSFNLIKLDKSTAGQANKLRLGQCVLALCNEAALDELTLRRNPHDPNARPVQVLPKGVEVTNIGNTVKDFLEAGYLTLSDATTQQLLERLCQLISKIPPTDMQQRSGQTLGNCGNLLRVTLECALRPSSSKAILQSPAYQLACSTLLKITASNDFWSGLDWHGKGDQTLANSASFLKAMDKWEQVDPPQLQAATVKLVQQIHVYGVELISEAQSVSSLLSALVVLGNLAPQGQVPALIESLLQTVAQQASNKWPPKSRALALRAALAQLEQERSLQANPAIDALLKAGAVTDDALPYLQAIRLRVKELAKQPQEQTGRLHGFQPMLRQLLAARASNPEPITLDEVEAAIRQLESREPVQVQRQTITAVDTPAPTTTAAATIKPKPVQPDIPGLTNTIKTNTAAFPPSTTRSLSFKPTVSKRRADQSDASWEDPSNVIGNQKTAVLPVEKPAQKTKNETLASSTTPVITSRTVQADKNSNSGSKKGSNSNSAKPVSTTKLEKPEGTAARGLSDKTRATMERQWFDVVRNKKMKGRMQVLEKLVLDYPALPTIKDSKSGKGQTALFDAMLIGDPVLVEWLLARMPVLDEVSAVRLLDSIFSAPIVVDDAVKSGLKIFMTKLGKPLSEQVTLQFGPKAAWAPLAYRDTLNQFQANGSNTTLDELDDYEPRSITDEVLKKNNLKPLEKSVNQAKASNPLLAAAFADDLEKVNILLNLPNAASMISSVENFLQLNPLSVAIYANNQAIAARLLQTESGKASALAKNQDGNTSLMTAIFLNQIGVVQLLLALPNAVELTGIADPEMGINPLMWAAKLKNYPIARLLAKVPGAEKQALHRAGKATLIHTAIIMNDRKMLDILLAMPNISDQINQLDEEEKLDAFNHAINFNQADIVDHLLMHEAAEKWLTSVNPRGFSPLIYALKNHFESVAESILNSRYGEKLSLQAPFGDQIPLMSAAHEGLKRSTTILLSMSTAKQQAMRINDAGMTALMLAASKGHTDIVKDLLALPNAKEQARMLHTTPSRVEIVEATNTEKIREHLNTEAIAEHRKISLSKQSGVPLEQLEKQLDDIEKSTIGMNARQMALANGHLETADLLLPFERDGQGQI